MKPVHSNLVLSPVTLNFFKQSCYILLEKTKQQQKKNSKIYN